MPATSQQQQKLFGLALAYKRGEVPASEVSDEIKDIADRMSEKDIEDFAATKHKGLPKMKEQLRKIVREIMRERAISEMNEQSIEEVASRTAMEIGGLTGMNKDAIQKFVDDNNLDIEKVFQYVKKGKLKDRMDLVSAIAGKPNNPVQKKMIKMFGESTNEADLPKAMIPNNIKAKLNMAIDKIKDTNLTYNQKLQVIGKIIDSLGIDKKELVKMSTRLKGTLESVTEASIDVDTYRKKQAFVIGPKFAEVASDTDVELMARLKRVNSEHEWQLKQNIKSMDHLYKKYKLRSKKGIEEGIESVNEGYSTEEKRIVLMAVKKLAKYRNVPLDNAINGLLGAGQELERDIQKGKIK
jgi:hypothetical protein